MKRHALKSWPQYFDLMMSGDKNFELRKNDRDYQVGDVCQFFEWNKEKGLTGRRSLFYKITYVLHKTPGLLPGYVVLLFDGPWFGKLKEELPNE